MNDVVIGIVFSSFRQVYQRCFTTCQFHPNFRNNTSDPSYWRSKPSYRTMWKCNPAMVMGL